ncbi:uncharacterized protein LOC132204260 isoform X1 [Neocloeon triangulifer]|uniref:uncharacterized protein LOC132204260 isoform X1 n=1 Tax=Neocloeon triangulifer TaxID=2078957 RepID=UPI00286F1142|nr:uncharacterized protein LOC132204260 isoform X1 [Neocloeon triangulifer]
MISPKRSKLSDMSQNDKKMDTSLGNSRMSLGGSQQLAALCDEIPLPLEAPDCIPEKFCIKKEYPEKKWAADSAHIKYRLDKDGNAITTANLDVFRRMFAFNKNYLQAILDGEIECDLLKMFQMTDPPHKMPRVTGSMMFGLKNSDVLVNLMMQELKLCADNMSGKCNLCMSVLLPELVAKMVGDMYRCGRSEAAQKMNHYSDMHSQALCASIL